MTRAQIERRLKENLTRLEAARSDLAVAEQQLMSLTEDAEELHTRAIVSENRLTAAEHREADRHAAAMRRHRDELITTITELEGEQDSLLDRLGAGG